MAAPTINCHAPKPCFNRLTAYRQRYAKLLSHRQFGNKVEIAILGQPNATIAKLIKSYAGLLRQVLHRAAVISVAALVLLLSGHAIASELTGTWSGTLTGDTTLEAHVTFSDAGYLIFSYTNNRGQTRSVELTTPGQQVQYVPPGGGVKTHTVDSVSQGSDRLSFVLRTTFERTNNGYMDQWDISESYDFVLSSQGLEMQLDTKSTKYLSDQDLSTGGANESVAQGVLQKN